MLREVHDELRLQKYNYMLLVGVLHRQEDLPERREDQG
jgi:hypothetical protein